MSAPSDQGGPSQDGPKGLSRFIRRASKVLRPKSISTAPQAPEATPGSPMITSPTFATMSTPSGSQAAPLASHPPATTSITRLPTQATIRTFNTSQASEPRPVEIPRHQPRDPKAHSVQQQEKAKALFAKYGFSLEARDWTPSNNRSGTRDTAWVEKKIRVRIHRECHKCQTSFGQGKVCVNCDHTRCKSCPRWPAKKEDGAAAAPTAAGQEVSVAKPNVEEPAIAAIQVPKVRAAGTATGQTPGNAGALESEKENIAPTTSEGIQDPALLTIDSIEQTERQRAKHLTKVHKVRGADVVYRPTQHRVRRICHKCDTLFKGRATDCENCGHQRCPSCPRDPTKFSKYPEGLGYPGDVPEPEPLYPSLERVYRKPRHRVRYTCHECNATFPSSNDRMCKNCKHSRCENCSRDPVKKEPKIYSEEVLRGLEGKLVGLQLFPAGNVQAIRV